MACWWAHVARHHGFAPKPLVHLTEERRLCARPVRHAAVLKVSRNANFGKLQAGYLFPEARQT